MGDGGRRGFKNHPDLTIGEMLNRLNGTPSFAAHPKAKIGWLERKIFRRGEWRAPAFEAAIVSLERTLRETSEVLNALTEPDLVRPVRTLPTSRFVDLSAGQMVARAIAHLYVHAADLNTLVVLGGGDDMGLPRWQEHVRISP